MSTEHNKALVRRVNEEGLNQHNPALVNELCAPDFVFHNASRTIQGLQAYQQFLSKFFTAFPDAHFTIEDMIAEGDNVVARYTLRGTHQGNFMGIPPTDKQITVTGIEIFHFANGKAVEEWVNGDDLGLLQQLGVIPAPGQAS